MLGCMPQRVPADGIQRHRSVIDRMSDDELLAYLETIEPLPDADDDDPAWLDDATWDRLELLLAVADAIGERRLVRAIAPLFARAALGDGYEMMQGLRHGPEHAVASHRDLAEILVPLLRHSRAGSRRWAVRELGILRELNTLVYLLSALEDPEPLVREEACMSVAMLAHVHVQLREVIRSSLQLAAERDASPKVRRHAQWHLDRLP
jgi:HEAT repeats